jgi:hypothetical protein
MAAPAMSNQFHDPRLKIERAKQHISDLHMRLLAFAQTDFYTLVVEKDSKTGEQALELEITKPVPEELALVMGDALHNLKSALDWTVNEVVFRRLKFYDSHTRFPLRETAQDLKGTIKGGLIKQASPAVTNYIVDVVKPYKGGNDALWALHDLNILDKHRLLLPVMQATALVGVCAEDDRGSKMVAASLIVTRNRAATSFISPGNIKVTNKGKAIPLIFFDKGLPLEGQSIIPALHQLAELVSGVVERIETVFFGEK